MCALTKTDICAHKGNPRVQGRAGAAGLPAGGSELDGLQLVQPEELHLGGRDGELDFIT